MFPANTGNQITQEYFCLLGGLENKNVQVIHRQNGTYHYDTYHLTCVG